MNLFLLIAIRLNILAQYHENYIEMNEFNYMLETDILRNSSQKIFGCRGGGGGGGGGAG